MSAGRRTSDEMILRVLFSVEGPDESLALLAVLRACVAAGFQA